MAPPGKKGSSRKASAEPEAPPPPAPARGIDSQSVMSESALFGRTAGNDGATNNLTIHHYSQLHNDSTEAGCHVYLVLPVGHSPTNAPPQLIEAYDLCKLNNISSDWIAEEDVLELAPGGSNAFVLEAFDGRAYTYLEGLFMAKADPDFVIIGPQVVKYVFLRDNPDLSHHGYPMLTFSMKNTVICLSGFHDHSVRDDLVHKIRLMGGMVSPQLTVATTHVVAFTPLRDKVFLAYGKDKPVMTADWIDKVYKDGINSVVHATDQIYSKYEMPLFYNLIFCFSQIPLQEKNALKNIVEQNGGKVYADLRKRQTNILIVAKPEGDKYRHAKSWRLPVLSPEWITASKEAGHVVPLSDYSVSGEGIMLTSTPETERVHTNRALGDITSIPYAASVVDQSILTSQVQLPSQRESGVGTSIQLRKSRVGTGARTVGNYLDGIKAYISGNAANQIDEAKRVLNASGAIRLDRISDSVTHIVVVGEKIPEKDLKIISKLSEKPFIVGMDWLIESGQKGERADEEIFAFDSDRDKQKSRNGSFPEPSPKLSRPPVPVFDELNVCAGMEQQFPQLPGEIDHYVPPSEFPNDRENFDDELSNACTNGTATGIPEDESVLPLFQGKRFLVALEEEDEDEEESITRVKTLITELEGELVDESKSIKNQKIDFVIANTVHTRADLMKYKMYTEEWLTDSYEERCIQTSNQPFYHFPLLRFNGSDSILQNIVLAISAYTAAEKDYITVVAKELGAIVQDVFSRKGKQRGADSILQTTHLVCHNMDNDKYKAALKWNVPVVRCEWIIDSFKAKSKIDFQRYLVKEGMDELSSPTENIPITPMGDLRRSIMSKDPLESAKSLANTMSRRTITPRMGGGSRNGTTCSSNNPTPTITPVSGGIREREEVLQFPDVEGDHDPEIPDPQNDEQEQLDEIPDPNSQVDDTEEQSIQPAQRHLRRKSSAVHIGGNGGALISSETNTNQQTPETGGTGTPKGPYFTPAARRHLSMSNSELAFTPTQSQTPGRAPSSSTSSPLVTLERLEEYYKCLLNESLPSPSGILKKIGFVLPAPETPKVEAEYWEKMHQKYPLTPESEALRQQILQGRKDRFDQLHGRGPIPINLSSPDTEVTEKSAWDDESTTDNSDFEKDKSTDSTSRLNVGTQPKKSSNPNKRSSDSLSDDESTLQESKKSRYSRRTRSKEPSTAGPSKRK